MQALTQALKSNNLDAAKAAFATLSANNKSGAASDPNSPLTQLGNALQKNDLSGAQQAFSQMKTSNHHRSSSATSATPAATIAPVTSNPTATIGNTVNVFV